MRELLFTENSFAARDFFLVLSRKIKWYTVNLQVIILLLVHEHQQANESLL